jgi:transcriptional regulator with XRE-family HTH domain
MDPTEVGKRLKLCREKAKLGLRELSRKAEVSPASLSAIEKGLSSPTLGTLQKVLKALGTDFQQFFSVPFQANGSFIFRAGDVKVVEDEHRKYAFVLPKGKDFRFEILMETISPKEKDPVWERHECDFGGVILEGGPVRLEVEGVGDWTLHKDDSYYVKAGQKHRATNMAETPLKMITIWEPPLY